MVADQRRTRAPAEERAISGEPRFFSVYRATRLVARALLGLYFRVRIHGYANIPATGPVILACTHQSVLDPVVIGAYVRRTMGFLAKDTLFLKPFFGWYLRRLGAQPVDRTAERGAIAGVRVCLEVLGAGKPMVFFPEGTRSSDGKLRGLQTGIALLARRSGAPVVPVIVDGTYRAWPRERRWPRPYRVQVHFGPALTCESKEPYDSFVRRLETAFRDLARSSGAEHMLRDGSGSAADADSPDSSAATESDPNPVPGPKGNS